MAEIPKPKCDKRKRNPLEELAKRIQELHDTGVKLEDAAMCIRGALMRARKSRSIVEKAKDILTNAMFELASAAPPGGFPATQPPTGEEASQDPQSAEVPGMSKGAVATPGDRV